MWENKVLSENSAFTTKHPQLDWGWSTLEGLKYKYLLKIFAKKIQSRSQIYHVVITWDTCLVLRFDIHAPLCITESPSTNTRNIEKLKSWINKRLRNGFLCNYPPDFWEPSSEIRYKGTVERPSNCLRISAAEQWGLRHCQKKRWYNGECLTTIERKKAVYCNVAIVHNTYEWGRTESWTSKQNAIAFCLAVKA